jgi:glycosyltransferase involved in cell wall biosynthesis
MAYIRNYIARPSSGLTFVAQSAWGWFAAVPREQVAAFADALGECWQHGPVAARDALSRAWRIVARIQAGLAAGAGRSTLAQVLSRHRHCAFLLVSHRSLDRERPIAQLRTAGAAFVPLLHDLIPLSHPEYTRPAQVSRHARRLATTAALADGILVNSAATAEVLAAHLPPGKPAIAVAPLGIQPPRLAAPPPAARLSEAGPPERPYFLCLGTIEPRKNHLLLLHIWRALAEAGGNPPRLVLVGRRGWENENILDLLDRCPALRGLVEEHGPQPDEAVARLLAGARALLFPSFAEGFGLPVAEALAAGAPVICSDLPAFREVAGALPEMLDPVDGAAWRDAILDYAAAQSPRRAAQLARHAGWRAPSWDAHFAVVDGLLERAVAARATALPGRHVAPVPRPAAAGPSPTPSRAGAVAPDLSAADPASA